MSKTKGAESVKVVVRCRPLNEKEIAANHERVVDMDIKSGQVRIRNPKASLEPPRNFTFDAVYDWNSKQVDLFEETFRDLIESVLSGFNGTIFAYGQTGTGKTFTMEGVRGHPEKKGVIPRSFDHIFTHIARTQDQQYLVRASYLEIYQEEIRDLLDKDQAKRLELKERPDTGVYVKDLLSFVTKSVKEIEHVMNVGNQIRSVGATDMNEHSSRSHAIFVITIECSETGPDGENHIRVGKLNLVDLAGSERQSKTGSSGERFKEATKINLSLSALGNVISALVDGKGHVPYRDSKLTRLLQDSLGGNAKTVMVANIGPASYNFDESVTTLRYANRAKNIKNKPRINEDPKDALLRQFQEEIARLKSQLQSEGGSGSSRKKKHRRITVDGHEESASDETDEGSVSEERQAQLEEEKLRIQQDENMAQEEKKKLLQKKEQKIQLIKKEQQAKDTLSNKIKAMESKLLVGGLTIVDHTNEQQRALEAKQREIVEQLRREREMKQKLEEREGSALEAHESYTSLQQEVEIKTKKLKKLYGKLQLAKAEVRDFQNVADSERTELQDTQLELSRESRLKALIVENFIPPEEKKKIEERIYFDDDEQCYKLRPIRDFKHKMMTRPISAAGGDKRPRSMYTRMASRIDISNPRYLLENILLVELDMPTRTTRDYEGPLVAPKVQAALDAALQEEGDLHLDASADIFSLKSKKKLKTRVKSSKTRSSRTSKQNEAAEYPTSRGLVPK